MKQIVVTLDSPDIVALEKQGDKDAMAKVHLIKVAFECPLLVELKVFI